jgi:hypothetical protein
MVLDAYEAKHPKAANLKRMYLEEKDVIGVFDVLETALHALDVISSYRSDNLEACTQIQVVRLSKNSIRRDEVLLVKWVRSVDTEQDKRAGIPIGQLHLCKGLATEDIGA